MKMNPKWLIEDFANDNSFHMLAKETKKQGFETEIIRYIPFQSGSYNVFDETDCVICQTSLNLAEQLIREKKWIPGPWLSLKNYECTKYYSYFGKYLLNDDYLMYPRGEVRRKLFYIKHNFGYEVFIRPSSGFKTFTGKVFNLLDIDKFNSDWEWVEEFTNPEDIVIISSTKIIEKEWRFVIAGNTIVTGSLYKKNGKSKYLPLQDEDDMIAKKQVKNILKEVTFIPDPMWTIDIAKTSNKQFNLLEIGCFSCAGLYACDMEKIVKVVSDIALKEYKEFYNEKNI